MDISLLALWDNSSTGRIEVTLTVVLITVRKELSVVDIRGNSFSFVFVLPVQAARRVSGIQPAGTSL